jgi:hypothetical protein
MKTLFNREAGVGRSQNLDLEPLLDLGPCQIEQERGDRIVFAPRKRRCQVKNSHRLMELGGS